MHGESMSPFGYHTIKEITAMHALTILREKGQKKGPEKAKEGPGSEVSPQI